MIEIKFYDPLFTPESRLIYSVIAARHGNEWIYVRHWDRSTWEIPGGHIEVNETADQTAVRELMEETGALEFTINCVATYSVETDGNKDFGRLYLANVLKRGPVPDTSEIEETKLAQGLPSNLTYPEIQSRLFEMVVDFLEGKSKL